MCLSHLFVDIKCSLFSLLSLVDFHLEQFILQRQAALSKWFVVVVGVINPLRSFTFNCHLNSFPKLCELNVKGYSYKAGKLDTVCNCKQKTHILSPKMVPGDQLDKKEQLNN